MRLKTFTAESLPAAMELVRERLGDDAVILSSQPDPDGGGFRVTAALEGESAQTGFFDGEAGLEAFNILSETLDYHRVPTELMDALLDHCGRTHAHSPTEALAEAIATEMSFAPPPEKPMSTPLLLAGPPGAGKTATAAKLAAQVRVRGGGVTMITMDAGKAGSLSQIQAFAEALGARLKQAHDAASLKKALQGAGRNHFVVIDAIGAGPFDHDSMEDLDEWLEASGATGVMVKQAGTDPVEAVETALAYADLGVVYYIPTKADATRRLGDVLSAAHSARLTLMGMGVSPTIGAGLRAVDAHHLARMLLPEDVAAEEDAISGNGANA